MRKQYSLAVDLGVDQSTLSRWGKGATLSLENAVKFCEVLDVSLDWLLLGRGDMEQHKRRPMHPGEWELLQEFRSLHPEIADSLARHVRSLNGSAHIRHADYATSLRGGEERRPAVAAVVAEGHKN